MAPCPTTKPAAITMPASTNILRRNPNRLVAFRLTTPKNRKPEDEDKSSASIVTLNADGLISADPNALRTSRKVMGHASFARLSSW